MMSVGMADLEVVVHAGQLRVPRTRHLEPFGGAEWDLVVTEHAEVHAPAAEVLAQHVELADEEERVEGALARVVDDAR